MTIHTLGYPRIGDRRELKFALEAYWRNQKSFEELETQAREIRYQNIQTQIKAGINLIPVNDFAYYDQVLNMSTLLGVIPQRFREDEYDIEISFRMARGRAPSDDQTSCCGGCGAENHGSKADYAGAMKKWFDTNYHYIVPELEADTKFAITDQRLFVEVAEALSLKNDAQDIDFKPVLIGPLTYLYLAELKDENLDIFDFLPGLVQTYQQILNKLKDLGINWVQIDEPILGLELEDSWRQLFTPTYQQLASSNLKILLASYFESLGANLDLVCDLPIAGFHYDGLRGANQLDELIQKFPANKVLSIGLVDGRNIWKTDLNQAINQLIPAKQKFADNLWIAPSCSLLHAPVDLDSETQLNPELKNYLAFAKQKLAELKLIADALNGKPDQAKLDKNQQDLQAKYQSKLIYNSKVAERLNQLQAFEFKRDLPYSARAKLQQQKFNLPLFPTTTIGSFPQTAEIRSQRRLFKSGEITEAEYKTAMQTEIRQACELQQQIGLDVFVHGEAERNDMVEYFGEQLDGYAFTKFGWVQSYGSRCVKPPIIYGDVSRPAPITVDWSKFAQAQTDKPMKGMLTGAVTMLNWSFVRDDQPRATTCNQIALALRDEVLDLEAAGIEIIQVDEAALREGLPLKKSAWREYLDWAVNSFLITTSGVKNTTQIHTHMCYSEFNDIIEAVAQMDADVITIETSKSQMKLLDAFADFDYPNQIGPGVYDIHSPNIPTVEQMVKLIKLAAEHLSAEQLWVNPDCGLKTRSWQETKPALENMVKAAKQLRKELQS